MADRDLGERLLTLASMALAPLTAAVAKRLGNSREARRIWEARGVLPLRAHYYSPVILADTVPSEAWEEVDPLAGVDWNEDGQLALLERLAPHAPGAGELQADLGPDVPRFTLDNPNFGAGDAETLFAMLRLFAPQRVVEVGSGWSTLVTVAARRAHGLAEHVCIEPFEMPWLERLPGVTVERSPVESLPPDYFARLAAGDVLFIDSSHVLRQGGDVVWLYLRVLPSLAPGVLVHVHDIFVPRPYPREWVEMWRFWNEAQLLQAFLAFNAEFEVLLALNDLAHRHRKELAVVAPSVLDGAAEPGSFWFMRRKAGA
jgi:hypothetical protein